MELTPKIEKKYDQNDQKVPPLTNKTQAEDYSGEKYSSGKRKEIFNQGLRR